MARRVHVAAAAIFDRTGGRVLVTRRAAEAHQGGLWEFPGGKVKRDESIEQALARELHEELGIHPLRSRPLLRIAHDYPDKRVLLDVWRVDAYAGEAHARENQPLRWLRLSELDAREFPAANRPVITALQLPELVLVTPAPPADDVSRFLRELSASIERHALRLVQLRAPELAPGEYRVLAQQVLRCCRERGVELTLNAPPSILDSVPAQGIHLPARALARYRARPVSAALRLSAACHDRAQLQAARRLGADFAYLSPVKPTLSHPSAPPLSWAGFARLVGGAGLPVYALGGLGPGDLVEAQHHGAQGVAAIRGLWVSDTAAGE